MVSSHEVLHVFLPVTCRIFIGVKSVLSKSYRKNAQYIYFSVSRNGFQGHLMKGGEHGRSNKLACTFSDLFTVCLIHAVSNIVLVKKEFQNTNVKYLFA
jgi:hypothetical protein